MEITKLSESNKEILNIKGLVKSSEEVNRIKVAFQDLLEVKYLDICFEDTHLIPSSLIGFLLKIIHEKKIELNIIVKKEELFELLTRLNLVKALNASQG